jgi:Rrf2 family protein
LISIIREATRMFSNTAEYALRAVVYLAEHRATRCTTQTIADSAHIPSRYLAKVLQSLARAGVLSAQRGLNGGFCLDRDPSEITLLEVVEAVEPLRRIKICPIKLEAHKARLCPLHTRLDESLALIEDNLRRATVAELLDRPTFRPVA